MKLIKVKIGDEDMTGDNIIKPLVIQAKKIGESLIPAVRQFKQMKDTFRRANYSIYQRENVDAIISSLNHLDAAQGMLSELEIK